MAGRAGEEVHVGCRAWGRGEAPGSMGDVAKWL